MLNFKKIIKFCFHFCLPFTNSLGNSYRRPNGKIFITDKESLRHLANQWTYNKNKHDPLYPLRICEALDTIKFYYEHFEDEMVDILIWQRRREKYIILVMNDDNCISVEGLLEHPENVYEGPVLFDIKEDLKLYSKKIGKMLDFSPMFKWSHGLYFRDLQVKDTI